MSVNTIPVVNFIMRQNRNRVAVQLQKNLDRVRLRRVAAKMKNATHGGYLISSHPSGLIIATKNLREATPDSDSEENSR